MKIYLFKISVIMIFLAIHVQLFSQIRNTEWGMKVEEVKAIETATLIEEEHSEEENSSYLVYKAYTSFSESPAKFSYLFLNDALFLCSLTFDKDASTPELKSDVVASIRGKYGLEDYRSKDKMLWELGGTSIYIEGYNARSSNEVYLFYSEGEKYKLLDLYLDDLIAVDPASSMNDLF